MGILLDGGTSLPQGAIGDAGHQGGRRQAASTSRSRDRSDPYLSPYRSANLLLFCLFAPEILVHLRVVLMWYDLGIEVARIRLALICIAD
jgi:hypothetical protein